MGQPAGLPRHLWLRELETAEEGKAHESALEELLVECYSYIFVSRLRSLQAQRALKPNIEGLIFLTIRHFLHERQKQHDPIGSQVFEVLQSAVRAAIGEGKLRGWVQQMLFDDLELLREAVAEVVRSSYFCERSCWARVQAVPLLVTNPSASR